ncbi:hypothetical protein FB45DRAFT_900717 [Roridomyces roridus]|uniref:F-box domain-containing protein n=1 Tax=Roridomyces roridus TaxID=1738132 RepID=A0AAD7C7X2_9AGAR|nr:hypothetical protein FB45DRAFT_900717 [Roridomyces roridus]
MSRQKQARITKFPLSLLQCLSTSELELDTAPLDPIAKLPLEISSQIFAHCVPLRPTPGAQHVPMLFLQMCKAWTVIALSTPQLWSSVHVVFPRPKGFAQLLETWLDRARYLPLSISLHGAFADEIGNVFRRYREQLETIEIYPHTNVEKMDIIKCMGADTMQPFPRLRRLTVGGTVAGSRHFLAGPILTMLRLSPVLVECIFDGVSYMRVSRADLAETISLPALRRLSFGCGSGPGRYSDDEILQGLSLPSLETLCTPLYGINSSHLVEFLERSTPPLTSLTIMIRNISDLTNTLRQLTALTPALTHLEFAHGTDFDVLRLLFQLLKENHLPQLRTLHLQLVVDFADFRDSLWEDIIHTLFMRCSILTKFTMRMAHKDVSRLPSELTTDVRTGLRDLVARGMDIYVGTEQRCYI